MLHNYILNLNLPINYTVIRSKVKNIRISVNRDGEVKFVIPMRYPIKELEKIVEQKKSWIEKKIKHFESLKAGFYLNDNEILYLGRKYTFILTDELKNRHIINEEKREIYTGIDLSDERTRNRWLTYEARRVIAERVNIINKGGRFKYSSIFIRNQKTKWGNCSGKRNISFNWRIIKAPVDVIDYLIIHELIHLEEMNHSKVFWEKVSQIYPDYKEANKWLKKNGTGLFY